MQTTKRLTNKNHHDPEQVNGQIPFLGVRVQEVEHDGSYDEEYKVAHLRGNIIYIFDLKQSVTFIETFYFLLKGNAVHTVLKNSTM